MRRSLRLAIVAISLAVVGLGLVIGGDLTEHRRVRAAGFLMVGGAIAAALWSASEWR